MPTITSIPRNGKTINTYLPMELLREIFLYSIEVNQIKSGGLASVCRYWRSVITTMAHLWSTLRVGTFTERQQVTTWLQRAYPKKVVIDTQRDLQKPANTPPFAALHDALASTGKWNELTISSFLSEGFASQLGFQSASSMDVLRALNVVSGCVHSPSFSHLLDLVPIEAPLSELRLYPSFVSTHFLQPHWFPVLQNLTVFIVNGRDIHEPFQLLPSFTRLRIFEADHLPLPWYEPNTSLPLLSTLQTLCVKASSCQWMAGREFPYLEECAIRLPHDWEAIKQYEVRLPSCRKLTYHGYPMTTVQYFHVPQIRAMELRSHDCQEKRVYQQLHHLSRLDGSMSKLTTLHLALQCSEQAFIKVLKYLGALEELVLSTAHPSPSWQDFLKSLAAKPSREDWPKWIDGHDADYQWTDWCSSQTWHANTLPNLKYLGLQCPKGFSQSECLDNLPILRLVAWTRSQLIPPLEHLKVWEGRGLTDDIVVDYISTSYLERHPGTSYRLCDSMILRAMATQSLVIQSPFLPFFRQLRPTVLFRQLHDLRVSLLDGKTDLLPFLEQVRWMRIKYSYIPAVPLHTDLPLVHTLCELVLECSTFSWMLGRTFAALEHCKVYGDTTEGPPMWREELQVKLPACTTLTWESSVICFPFISCPKVQRLRWLGRDYNLTLDEVVLKSLHGFLFSSSCLQELLISIRHSSRPDSLIHFVFCDAWEQGVWKDIRKVKVVVQFVSADTRDRSFNQMVGQRHYYGKQWKEFEVTAKAAFVILRAWM